MLYGLLLNRFVFADKDENIIIFEDNTGMHLNQSFRLVVDINRMHFLCMDAGSITLTSSLLHGPQKHDLFLPRSSSLRGFSEDQTLFAGT